MAVLFLLVVLAAAGVGKWSISAPFFSLACTIYNLHAQPHQYIYTFCNLLFLQIVYLFFVLYIPEVDSFIWRQFYQVVWYLWLWFASYAIYTLPIA